MRRLAAYLLILTATGLPGLAAALEAVMQWVYQPIKVDGKPVRVLNLVTFKFNGRG